MLFHSFEFLFFFIITIIIFYAIPRRFQWLFLLVCSCVFFMFFKPEYILILFLSILIDYLLAFKISSAKAKQRVYLIIGLFANISLLLIFKYFHFFNEFFKIIFQNTNIRYTYTLFIQRNHLFTLSITQPLFHC